MAKPELVIYGASNAAGYSAGHDVDYNTGNLAEATFVQPPFVSETAERIIVDLSHNPAIEDGNFVQNESIPGMTAVDLLEDFGDLVLNHGPNHVFIWTGLNDPVMAVYALHPEADADSEGSEIVDLFKSRIRTAEGADAKLQASADFVVENIRGMVSLAQEHGVNVLVGTLPPFASTLASFENNPREPIAGHISREGKAVVNLINERIRAFGQDACVVDAYAQVVDTVTGLSKVEYSYGATRRDRSGDILHLNSFGQISIAAVLCTELHKKPVSFVPPDGTQLKQA